MRGARTDITNMGGDSLLHLAAAHGKYDVIMKVCDQSLVMTYPWELHANTEGEGLGDFVMVMMSD